jgi:hypothetical protein
MRPASARSNHPAHDTQSTVTAAAASGLETLQPIALLISMLRMWAHSLERFAANYEKALDETRREARRTRASVTHAQTKSSSSGASKPEPLEASPWRTNRRATLDDSTGRPPPATTKVSRYFCCGHGNMARLRQFG